MRPTHTSLVATLVVGAAVWAAWPAPVREGVRFAPPESIDLEFPDGGIPAHVVCTAGRVVANRSAGLVFRWLVDPVSIEVSAVEGAFELRLGPTGTGTWLQSDGQELQLRSEQAVLERWPLPDSGTARVRLLYEDGAYRVQLDGREQGAPIARPPPTGPAALLLAAGASMVALDCDTADGISRHVEGDPPPPGFERTAWAGFAACIGLACLGGWWMQLAHARAPGLLARAAALLSAAALVVGLPLSFLDRNAERGERPEPCELTVYESREPRLIEPGRPWTLPDRRDGDYRLEAEVVLLEGAVLDILLRAGLPLVDRQLLVTLSADEALPSGVGRNLGTLLETEPAKGGHALLPAGRPLQLAIECRDERTEAWVDGHSLGVVRDFDLRAGRTALHALAGAAEVSELRLEPAGPPRSLAGLLTGYALALGGGVLGLLLLLAGPCRLRWGALLWIWPLSVVVAPMTGEPGQWFAACAAALLFVPLAVRAAAGGRTLVALLAGVPAVALVGAALWGLQERPAQLSPAILNRLRTYDIAGPPVPAAYAWARHPLCRRFNPYLRAQQFRDREHTVSKPAGVWRIVALGSSSTYGYGIAAKETWAAHLERFLSRGEGRAEVINAGVPGATAERLRSFLGSVLLPMQPDVVIVDLSFNDRSISGPGDERAHFEAMTTRGIGGLERVVARWSAARRERDWGDYVRALEADQPVSDEARARCSSEPARRFQDSLRDLASACRQAGAALVLVQEPQRPGLDARTLAPYHAAMADLGRELGLPVVSPQAALDAAAGPTFLDAVHPTPAGHVIIARAIATALDAAGLAPRLPPARGFR